MQTPLLPAAAATPGTDAANALPAGHRLHEFELRGVIGVGGFGIVYRAFDHSLERDVAIKEYLPAALAGRSGKQQVSLLSASHSETFALGMSSFVNEAKLLARFDHPSLLKVHRFWEDNGTAYMVMPLYKGVTLRQLRQNTQRCPDGEWLMRLTDQLLGALDMMHKEGVFHRDIAPDNVIVADGSPAVLLDFGAARRVISDRSQTLTAILKPSYAPLEQYAESQGMRQGPWTDFYALGATLHYVIAGKPPVPATARALSDDQPRLAGSTFGNVPDLLLQVVDWMLAPRPQDRPQHVAELRAALTGHLAVPQRQRAASEQAWQTTVVHSNAAPARAPAQAFEPDAPPVARRRRVVRGVPLWGTAVAMAITAALGAWWAATWDDGPVEKAEPAVVSPVPAPVAAVGPVPAARTAMDAAPIQQSVDAEPARDSAAAKPPAEPVAVPRVRVSPTHEPRTADQRLTAQRAAEPRAVRPAAAATPAPPPATVAHNPVPAAVPETPAPTSTPTQAPVTVAVVTRNPREQCAGRHLVAMHRCLVRECEKAEFQAHRECQRVRDIEARTRNTLGG
ncbi:MAG TPA: protein kinase [Burkholderiaceae bacterium]|nr:protein kinase [Burkholderiaceae bacterium]